ncbi:MAG TPA: SDR family NAD(P)-dependent oxidoreductase, partial [Hyphomicrobiaceae bacterium]|nr:SDR family NAD(P)-dependent oxidoreductase [Hyphomicrobiaceae bacterium]
MTGAIARSGLVGANVVCLGLGYSASVIAERLVGLGAAVVGTRRRTGKAEVSDHDAAVRVLAFDGSPPGVALAERIAAATHLIVSIPPGEGGDPALAALGPAIAAAPRLGWIGYLSTIGVYG